MKNFYSHQKLYYEKLVKQKSPYHGLVCIPTGGGKTRLAAYYAIEEVLKKSKKVLWITHSQYLLNQAFETFKSLIKNNSFIEEHTILIHSEASKVKDLNTNHMLIFASFQSLINCKINWKDIIGKDVTIIIDEAHHVVAPTYMRLIKEYAIGKDVLGLSATPIRSKSWEENDLYNFFETDFKVEVHLTKLLEEKILVRPLFEEVNFRLENSDVDSIEVLSKNLSKEIENYNLLIFNKYKEDEAKYGKTVIFAIDIEHVNSLYKLFANNGYKDRVYKVYSGQNDRDNQFDMFSKSKDGILININIMNEGVDIPDIQTIFMTKPLNSKITTTQIVGRALRRADSISKKHAYIVNFAISNLGRKFLLVTPKLSYALYEAEWNNTEAIITNMKPKDKNISAIRKLVEEVIQKKVTCSFSNVFLVGHFTIIKNEKVDFTVPVTFREYREIIKYISQKKQNQQNVFPRKLFFNEETELIQTLIDKVIASNDEVIFTKYDEEIFGQLKNVFESIKNMYTEIISQSYSNKKIENMIKEFHKSLKSEVSNYLNHIGVNDYKTFELLVENEFTIVKYKGE